MSCSLDTSDTYTCQEVCLSVRYDSLVSFLFDFSFVSAPGGVAVSSMYVLPMCKTVIVHLPALGFFFVTLLFLI